MKTKTLLDVCQFNRQENNIIEIGSLTNYIVFTYHLRNQQN